MSRGLGRWQRLLLHELYHNPQPPDWFYPEPHITPYRFGATDSERSAVHRAARSLVAKGLARPRCYNRHDGTDILFQAAPAPDITCPQCGRKCCELANARRVRNT